MSGPQRRRIVLRLIGGNMLLWAAIFLAGYVRTYRPALLIGTAALGGIGVACLTLACERYD